MDILIILNDPPYGNERSYNGLRMAKALSGKENIKVSVFLMSDAVTCAKSGQNVPVGFYNIKLMLKSVLRKGEVLLCGTCMDAGVLAILRYLRRPNVAPCWSWQTSPSHRIRY